MARATAKKSEPWPLGQYLRECRGKMAMREAARRAHLSESWWRMVESGIQRVGGVEVPVQPSPETLASMARAIGADVTRTLELGGYRPEQYGWLLEQAGGEESETYREWFSQLPREEREGVLAELQKLHVDTELKRVRKSRAS